MEPQCRHRVGVVDGADEVDLVGRRVHDRPVVLVLVRSVGAEHHQAHPALPSGEGADELEDRVLRDRPTDQREIGARLQAERGDRRGARLGDRVRSVGDRGDLPLGRPGREVDGDLGMICDEGVADHARDPLVGPEDGLPGTTPAGPGPLDAVHVDDVGDAQQPLERVEDRGVVAEGQAEVPVTDGVEDGPQVEQRRAQPPVEGDGNDDPLDSVPDVGADPPPTFVLAVDDDPPPLVAEEQGDVLGRGLEPAVVGGDAVSSEDADCRLGRAEGCGHLWGVGRKAGRPVDRCGQANGGPVRFHHCVIHAAPPAGSGEPRGVFDQLRPAA